MATALVIGGGIGGVATALALRRVGWEVVVAERAPQAAEAGAGITMFPNAQRGLDAIGVGDRIRALPSGKVAAEFGWPGGMRSPAGRWMVRTGDGPDGDMWGLHRRELHTALLGAVPDGVVRYGAEVTGLAENADGVRASVGGEPLHADVLIGSDGIGSRVRGWLFPDHPGLRYGGYTSWRGISTGSYQGETCGETWGRGRRVGIVPIGDGRTYWYATDNAPEAGRDTDVAAELAERFGNWHAPIPELLADTPAETILRLDIVELAAPLPSYVTDRVALVGDAAHAMTPDLGQGMCQAIEDSVTLAACLADAATDPSAAPAGLRRYDGLRRPRTQRIADLARRMGRAGQVDGPVATPLRDLTLRAAPRSLMLGPLRHISSWRPPEFPVAV